MQLYVGITDNDWFRQLRNANAFEVNFWSPGTASFSALNQNEMFLFKLHAPENYIVGGGFFVSYSKLPSFLAWEAFGEMNGVKSLDELNKRIYKYRSRNSISDVNPEIGCRILTDCFWFDEDDWIPVPEGWSKSIVQGKRYYDTDPVGLKLFNDVQERLQKSEYANSQKDSSGAAEAKEGYIITPTKHRLGQGAFRVRVTDAYQRRCAITGEKTLPVLEAAHIRAFSKEGPNSVDNGILLKSDFHTLFDKGYITITPNYTVEVSDRLHEDYGNGKDYYKYNGHQLIVLPNSQAQKPDIEYLQWHNENVYVG